MSFLSTVVPMGSADHRFCLAEILSQSYGVREGSSEAACGPEQPEEEPDKHFGSQVRPRLVCLSAGVWPLCLAPSPPQPA